MIYFYDSTRKSDKLIHPITVCTSSEQRAFGLALVQFIKHGLKGSPKRIKI